MTRKALGRGLGALIPEEPTNRFVTTADPISMTVGVGGTPIELPLAEIASNPYQPRHRFDEAKLQGLADSIRVSGLLQPVLVRQSPDGRGYQLIAGERRLKAAELAGRATVPAVVRTASRKEMLEFAIIENVQREDLDPIEESHAYQRMATEFDLTQEQIAARVGKDRTTVANALRLLNLSEPVQDLLSRGAITTGHARCLLAIESPAQQEAMAEEIIKLGLSVRQVEEMTAGLRQKRVRGPGRRGRVSPALSDWEDRLRRVYGTQVRIVGGTARGRVEISYFSESDLERVLEVAGLIGEGRPRE
ncbi:MAG: ParB/RepB/Spo0J family partition protein [Candidatus Eisenbacteria bacterium]|nr:ParB/RepB/Spo0J family partition protein [Candidatus Eisenbacteria bacterium]